MSSTPGERSEPVETVETQLLVECSMPLPVRPGEGFNGWEQPSDMVSKGIREVLNQSLPSGEALEQQDLVVHQDGPFYTVLPPRCPECGHHLQFEPPSFRDTTTVVVLAVCPDCSLSGTGIFRLSNLQFPRNEDGEAKSAVRRGFGRADLRTVLIAHTWQLIRTATARQEDVFSRERCRALERHHGQLLLLPILILVEADTEAALAFVEPSSFR
jgi:hypothetical protein